MKRVNTTEWVDDKENTLIRQLNNGKYSVVIATADDDGIRALLEACEDVLNGPDRNDPDLGEQRAMGVTA